jgi:hypothetical protein
MGASNGMEAGLVNAKGVEKFEIRNQKFERKTRVSRGKCCESRISRPRRDALAFSGDGGKGSPA